MLLIIKENGVHIRSNLEPMVFSIDATSPFEKFISYDFSTYLFFLEKCVIFYCWNTKAMIIVQGKKGFILDEHIHQLHNILINSRLQKEFNPAIYMQQRERADLEAIKRMEELYNEAHQELSNHLDN